MRRLVALLPMLLLLASCGKQPAAPPPPPGVMTAERMSIRGPVETVTQEVVEVYRDTPDPLAVRKGDSRVYRFDRDGVLREYSQKAPGQWLRRRYDTDERKRVRGSTIERSDGTGGVMRLRERIVYPKPNEQRSELYDGDRLVAVIERRFDATGRPREEIEYDGKSARLARTVYTYDDLGLLINRKRYGPDGTLLYLTNYVDNENGLPIYAENRGANGELTEARAEDGVLAQKYKWTHQYDQYHNPTEKVLLALDTESGEYVPHHKWQITYTYYTDEEQAPR